MPTSIRPRWGLAAPLLFLAAACTDSPLVPAKPEPEAALTKLRCDVSVAAQSMTCTEVTPITLGGARSLKIGGQDKYVRISGTGSYDGTQFFQANVTVQNLLQQAIGTNGTTTTGVRVFFHDGPTRTGGASGSVSVFNPTGTAIFTGAGQPYFEYMEVLDPNEISSSKTWVFDLPNTVTTFSFTLGVEADVANTSLSLLDKVWVGVTSSWETLTNWSGSTIPTATSAVSIPIPSELAPTAQMPVMGADATILHLRVGTGSTLGLGGFTLQVDGNADAPGVISSGTLRLTGTGALLRGFVPSLQLTGSTFLQGSTKATGAVSVTGSLTTNGNPLNISVP